MDAVETPVVEQPAEPVAPVVETSVADHAAQFGPTATEDTAAAAAEKAHHSAEQRREKDTGQFKPGKTRHRAASQQASPEDVPRIQQLTARAKAAEERLQTAESELAKLKAQHASPAVIAKAEAKVEAIAEDEPKEDDPKYNGDYAKYLRDAARYDARQEIKAQQKADADARAKAEQDTKQRDTVTSWQSRVIDARETYDDFDAVAFSPNAIPDGSVVDRWIMEHKTGPHVLYYLQAHPQERDEILGVGDLEQYERLTLLSQRFSSPPSPQAGMTGSAARPVQVILPPKPPNPVRTEAQRASELPPPTDGSLSIAEHSKHFGRR